MEIVNFRLKPEIKELVKQMANAQGVSISEYLRKLVINDLDQRNVFTDELKQKLQRKA
ncbi:MAG: plasmid mobilization protein [Candidatus Freyarchaeota archaeon]